VVDFAFMKLEENVGVTKKQIFCLILVTEKSCEIMNIYKDSILVENERKGYLRANKNHDKLPRDFKAYCKTRENLPIFK